jgi:hydrogenase-4 component E
MNVPGLEWLPRSSAVNLLAGLFLLSALYTLSRRRAAECVSGYTWNSVSLALISAVVALSTGARHIWIATGLILAIKGFLIPRLLRARLASAKPGPEPPPLIGIPASTLIGGALVVLAFAQTRQLFGSPETVLGSCLPVSMASALVGLFLMVTRRQPLLQVVGLLIVENAIFLAAVSLTYGMPLVVEMGVLLDVLVGVALLGLFVGRIEETFESADTARMTSLKG